MTFLPIVGRELRVAARKKGTYWLRFFAALAAIGVFSFIALADSGEPSWGKAQEMFGMTSAIALVVCLSAGIFQTSDCLSSEKREGTLGLLFLTDLHGYDIVLGKLASTSLHAFYGLLSVLPILALPLLTGGVTGGEFWRITVILLVALFFSLSAGMMISTLVRESRQALVLTVFTVVFMTGLLPAIYMALSVSFSGRLLLPSRPFFWPSLGYAFREADDSLFGHFNGPIEYWGSILTVLAIGFFCLLMAAVVLPRAWQERGHSGTSGGRTMSWLRFGTPWRRTFLRLKFLDPNPFFWFAIRDRLPQLGVWPLLGLGLPLWLAFFFSLPSQSSSGSDVSEFLMFTTFGLTFLFKCMVASEATRRFCEDRRSGAWELLLVTPLTEKQIFSGQKRALVRAFWLPLPILFFLGAVTYWQLQKEEHDAGLLPVLILGSGMVLLTDFYALGWVGMWMGMRERNHALAILGTLARILFIPWLCYFLLGVSGLFDLGPAWLFAIWFPLGAFNDWYWARRAKNALRNEFRARAAGLARKPFRERAPAIPRQITA